MNVFRRFKGGYLDLRKYICTYFQFLEKRESNFLKFIYSEKAAKI